MTRTSYTRHDLLLVAAWLLLWSLVASCAAALVPSGIPGCPERQQWSDSAQACRPVEGR